MNAEAPLCAVEVANGRAEKAWWFPSGSTKQHRAEAARAKAVCALCPIRAACLEETMRVEAQPGYFVRHGIFGGFTAQERYELAGTTGREWVCEVCAEPFVAVRARKTCTPRCELIRSARYMREYQRAERNSGKANPIGKHGTIRMAHTGCTCVACRGRRRNLKREARLAQRLAQGRMQEAQGGEAA